MSRKSKRIPKRGNSTGGRKRGIDAMSYEEGATIRDETEVCVAGCEDKEGSEWGDG